MQSEENNPIIIGNMGSNFYKVNRRYCVTLYTQDASGYKTYDTSPCISNPIQLMFVHTVALQAFNSCVFRFYNINDSIIEKMSAIDTTRGIQLKVGYSSGEPDSTDTSILEPLFEGMIFRVINFRENADIVTEVICVDRMFSRESAKYTLQLEPGHTGADILDEIANKAKGQVKFTGTQNLMKNYSFNRYIVNQTLSDVLNSVCADNNCNWSVTKKGIRIAKEDAYPINISYISPNNGLIGNVRAEGASVQLLPISYFSSRNMNNNIPVISATVLLRPFELYDAVQFSGLEQKQFNNRLYRIYMIEYVGNLRGEEWFANLKLWSEK